MYCRRGCAQTERQQHAFDNSRHRTVCYTPKDIAAVLHRTEGTLRREFRGNPCSESVFQTMDVKRNRVARMRLISLVLDTANNLTLPTLVEYFCFSEFFRFFVDSRRSVALRLVSPLLVLHFFIYLTLSRK